MLFGLFFKSSRAPLFNFSGNFVLWLFVPSLLSIIPRLTFIFNFLQKFPLQFALFLCVVILFSPVFEAELADMEKSCFSGKAMSRFKNAVSRIERVRVIQ